MYFEANKNVEEKNVFAQNILDSTCILESKIIFDSRCIYDPKIVCPQIWFTSYVFLTKLFFFVHNYSSHKNILVPHNFVEIHFLDQNSDA